MNTYEVDDFVTVMVPKKNRYKMDTARLPAKIIKISHNASRYLLATRHGRLSRHVSGDEILPYSYPFEVDTSTEVTLAEAHRLETTHMCLGLRCNCKSGCKNYMCRCRQNLRPCETSCHFGGLCEHNHDAIGENNNNEK